MQGSRKTSTEGDPTRGRISKIRLVVAIQSCFPLNLRLDSSLVLVAPPYVKTPAVNITQGFHKVRVYREAPLVPTFVSNLTLLIIGSTLVNLHLSNSSPADVDAIL